MRTRTLVSWSLAAALLALAGCSDDGPADPDGGVPADTGGRSDGTAGDGSVRPCGNGTVDDGEECDDGNMTNDDGCHRDCTLECGDGEVTGAELCDTAITTGAGACPTSCDDGDACTVDALSGEECSAECTATDITAAVDGDGCCPAGADATTDDDCSAVCGNMIVESGETCDTGIATGTGSCPASCDDGNACTTDTTTGALCTAACSSTPITTIGPDDGCCPSGGTAGADPDCAGCGDGTVVAPETCDTAIATGTGSCPTSASCNDANACTTDSVVAAGTCMATCSNVAIGPSTGPMDGCCPTGATIATDSDCAARCGDGVITAPEACDDGNTMPGDGCSATCATEAVATAYRFTDLDLRDPHVFANITSPLPLGCQDVTNTVFGQPGINPLLQDNITMDGDSPPDGQLDLSIATVFRPLEQRAGMTTMGDLVFPDCTAPMSSTMCTLPAGAMHLPASVMNMGASSTCLGLLAGTTRTGPAYTPAIVLASSMAGETCFVANAGTVTFDLGGIPIRLQQASIGGVYSGGTPATDVVRGLIRGFLSEADANAAIIPAGTTGMSSIDGQPVSRLLRGGVGACRDASPAMGDADTLMDGTRGWWFYLNFTARRAPYSEL